jgi:hypothetical protein
VGVIGGGSAARAYLRTLDSLVAGGNAAADPVCVRRPEARESFLRARPGAHLVSDVAEVLDADIDLILITTPPGSHAELARLDHDVHVIDVLAAAARSAADDGRPVPVSTEFGPLDLTYDFDPSAAAIHDRTRPRGDQ